MAKSEFAAGCMGCLTISLLGFCACGGFLAYVGRTAQNTEVVRSQLPTTESRPREIDYRVTIDQDRPPIKRVVSVQLPYRITESELRSIALELQRQAGGRYQRIFIAYLLPGMKPGEGAWATTHFDPDLSIRVLGSTIEAEAALLKLATAQPDSKDYIGQWKDRDRLGAGLIRIYRGGEKFYLEQLFTDGSEKLDELKAFSEGGSVRLVEVDELDAYLRRLNDAEYWELQSNGQLAICGVESGEIFRYEAIPLNGATKSGSEKSLELKVIPTAEEIRDRYPLKPLEPKLSDSDRTKLEAICNDAESMINDLAEARMSLLRPPVSQAKLEQQGVFARSLRQRADKAKSDIASFRPKASEPKIDFTLHFALAELVGVFDRLHLNSKDAEFTKAMNRLQPKLRAIRAELARHRPGSGGERSQFRTWTSADGNFRTEAKFVSMLNGKVRLEKANGVQIEVALDVLSEADQRLVRDPLSDAND